MSSTTMSSTIERPIMNKAGGTLTVISDTLLMIGTGLILYSLIKLSGICKKRVNVCKDCNPDS